MAVKLLINGPRELNVTKVDQQHNRVADLLATYADCDSSTVFGLTVPLVFLSDFVVSDCNSIPE
jgi:hypothetical protein